MRRRIVRRDVVPDLERLVAEAPDEAQRARLRKLLEAARPPLPEWGDMDIIDRGPVHTGGHVLIGRLRRIR
jgi:hypothetical protein